VSDLDSTQNLGDQPPEAIGLALRVVAEGLFELYPLPREGSVSIGRAETANVRIDDPAMSRLHAMLHLGPQICVEDLGSANGTRVRGRVLKKGERAPIALGEAMELGKVIVILQASTSDPSLAVTEEHRAATLVPPAAETGSLPVADDAMAQVRRLVELVAPATITVLLTGETGVGKEVTAELVHRLSPRRDRPLVRLNCAALSESLLESELFGYERGAFTGANQTKPGLLETADGGSVFLDEIGELSPSLQVKLLRVLEDRQVLRVGALSARKIDVRFIAATNRDLEKEVASGGFRRDLFFRLNGITIAIPPLRERSAEIEPLARSFAEEAARSSGGQSVRFSQDALALLRAHPWPGNVRELRNVVERAVLLSRGETIRPEHLVLSEDTSYTPFLSSTAGLDPGAERQRVLDALAQCAGNQTQAARLLGISRSTLVARLDAFKLPRPRKR
jgi:transcriptional regulator with PAS, ATPase and Fis domain